jgi:2-succinyl-6-hydroxy-2,4-cyclohexadiene-1-carboxylate synthase
LKDDNLDADNLWFETHGKKSSQKASTLLLLHGFTGSHFTWDRLCRKLSEDCFFLIVPDLPGHGRSAVLATPNSKAMTLDATSDNLRKVLDVTGVRKTALLGYSLGGRIALHFALKYQDRLTCLILESASPGIRDPKERETRKMEDDSLANDIEKYGLGWFADKWENMPFFATQQLLDPQALEMVRRERLSHTANGLAASLRSAGTGMMEPIWSHLDRLKIPVLLIVGEKDKKFMKIGEEMKKRMPSNCTIKIVKNEGHAIHLENPELFEEIVKQFLDDVYRNTRGKKAAG